MRVKIFFNVFLGHLQRHFLNLYLLFLTVTWREKEINTKNITLFNLLVIKPRVISHHKTFDDSPLSINLMYLLDQK